MNTGTKELKSILLSVVAAECPLANAPVSARRRKTQ